MNCSHAFLSACLLFQTVSCFRKTEIHSDLVGRPPSDEFAEEGFKRVRNVIHMKAAYLNNYRSLHDDLRTGARFDRNSEGIRIGRIKEDSIFAKFGFHDGDIILNQGEGDIFLENFEVKLKADRFISIKIKRGEGYDTINIYIN